MVEQNFPTPEDKVREELLTRGIHDWVPMSEIDSVIIDNHLVDSVPAKQELALRSIRSLIEDGLMVIGDLTGEGGRFLAWDVPLEAAMQRVHDRYVMQYGDRHGWVFSMWLDLTEAGEELARRLEKTANAE